VLDGKIWPPVARGPAQGGPQRDPPTPGSDLAIQHLAPRRGHRGRRPRNSAWSTAECAIARS